MSESPRRPDPRELARTHLRLVRSIVARILKACRVSFDADELYSFGCVGLMLAARGYDAGRGTCFSTYAYPRVQGAIIDGIAALSPLPRSQHRRAKQGTFVRTMAGCHLDTLPAAQPTVDELADRRRASARLHEVLEDLGGEAQTLLVEHYFDGQPLAITARKLNRSKTWASRSHKKALARLRTNLADLADCA